MSALDDGTTIPCRINETEIKEEDEKVPKNWGMWDSPALGWWPRTSGQVGFAVLLSMGLYSNYMQFRQSNCR